jgi:hypothetical protein
MYLLLASTPLSSPRKRGSNPRHDLRVAGHHGLLDSRFRGNDIRNTDEIVPSLPDALIS